MTFGVCPTCKAGVERVDGGPTPDAQMVLRCAPCGHSVPFGDAADLRVPMRIEPLNGATLATMERNRQVTEEGHTADTDAALPPNALGWMSWSLVDRAMGGRNLNDPPLAWPVETDRWPMNKTPLRMLVIAAALLLAEIDRRLANGERP